MSDNEKDSEPLYVRVPTAELKQMLSERFERKVSSDAWARIWRALTFIGITGIAAVGGVLWKVLDTEVTSKVSDQRKEVVAEVKKELEREIGALRNDVVPNRVREAFSDQSGQALQEKLRAALEANAFQAEMRERIHGEVPRVFAQESESLRRGFLQQLAANPQFLSAFAQHVAGDMVKSGTVSGIIAASLETYLSSARPEDTGRTSALALLAAMDQNRANAVVSHLLVEAGKHGQQQMALQGLQHVSFDGIRVAEGDAAKMLEAALASWSAHCAATACEADAASARGIESFLARGRQLPGKESDAWVRVLAVWHEELLRGEGRARKASPHLVPRALGVIGTPEARNTLVAWFKSTNTDLSLSVAMAVGGQAATSFTDTERLTLFKALWPKATRPEARRAVLAEAEWMALGRVSDGQADPESAFRPEASSIRARPPQRAWRPEIARWAEARSADFERQRAPRPPSEPCAVGLDAPSQHRVELCALAALIRTERGAVEWTELRRVTPWEEDEVGVLGLLWAISASRTAEGVVSAEARLAPLPDLLRMRPPAPPVWQLAAMLLLRAAPEQAGWQALGQLRPTPADAQMFVAASRWLFRPWAVTQALFVEELRDLPAPVRPAVLREIAAAALPRVEAEAEENRDNPLPAVVRRLSLAGVAPLNALRFAYAAVPDAALAAVESENGFRLLEESAGGGASGGGAQANVAGELLAALLDRAGWSRAVVAMAPGGAEAPLAGPSTPLAPSFEGRFGRLRLTGGDTLTLEPSDGAKSSGAPAPVVLYNSKTRETRVLAPRASWTLPGFAVEEWMFRLGADGPAAQLLAVPAETLVPAESASAASLPVLKEGLVYTVHALAGDPDRRRSRAGLSGWARMAGLRAGDRILLSTFDLADEVDTVVEIHHGAAEPERDDDGGGGLASRLEWTAERNGEVLVRLGNIGEPGVFRLKAERLGAGATEAAANPARSVFRSSRPR